MEAAEDPELPGLADKQDELPGLESEQDELTRLFNKQDESQNDCSDYKADSAQCLDVTSRLLVPPWRSLFAVSAVAMVHLSVMVSNHSLQSSFNARNDLGVSAVGTVYVTSSISCLFMPNAFDLLGPKACILVSVFMQLIFDMTNFFQTFEALIPGALVSGVSNCCLAFAFNSYLSCISISYMVLKSLPRDQVDVVMSSISGMFFFLYKSSEFTGHLLSSTVFFYFSSNNSALINNTCGMKPCDENVDEDVDESETERGSQEAIYALFYTYIGCHVVAMIITYLCVPGFSVKNLTSAGNPAEVNSSEGKTEKLRVALLAWKELCKDIKLWLLLPMIIAQSMTGVIVYASYTKSFVTCSLGIRWVGFSLCFMGVASSLSSLTINTLIRYTGRPPLILSGFVFHIVNSVIMLSWQPDHNTSVVIFFIVPLINGMADGVMQRQENALVTYVFKRELSTVFSAVRFLRYLGFGIPLLLSPIICFRTWLMFTLCLHVLGATTYSITEIRERLQEHTDKEDTKALIKHEIVPIGVPHADLNSDEVRRTRKHYKRIYRSNKTHLFSYNQ